MDESKMAKLAKLANNPGSGTMRIFAASQTPLLTPGELLAHGPSVRVSRLASLLGSRAPFGSPLFAERPPRHSPLIGFCQCVRPIHLQLCCHLPHPLPIRHLRHQRRRVSASHRIDAP